jgi:hypothetical protein
MKIAVARIIAIISVVSSAHAQTAVHGYVRKDGTYVQPHYKTAPDNSRFNNYSTQGNYNPYTGQNGTVNPYAAPSPYGMGGGRPNSYQNPYGR